MPIASENLSPANPPVKLGHRFKNKLGMKFGLLEVVELFDSLPRQGIRWRCKCECGRTVVVLSSNLKKTKSCGCLIGHAVKHGAAVDGKRTPEYKTWDSMKERCNNPNKAGYEHYGGRGIVVCERWLHSFANFLEDMGRKPTPNHSIDRWPDANGNYEPGNCRWATNDEQQNNRRNNALITFQGRTQNMAQWAREIGIPRWLICHRLNAGWTVEKALTDPVIVSKQRFVKVNCGKENPK